MKAAMFHAHITKKKTPLPLSTSFFVTQQRRIHSSHLWKGYNKLESDLWNTLPDECIRAIKTAPKKLHNQQEKKWHLGVEMQCNNGERRMDRQENEKQ